VLRAGISALSSAFDWLPDRFGRRPVILGGRGLLVCYLLTAGLSDGSPGNLTACLTPSGPRVAALVLVAVVVVWEWRMRSAARGVSS